MNFLITYYDFLKNYCIFAKNNYCANMNEIQIRKEYNITDLRKDCEKSKSRIYGFILFTDRDPYLISVLENEVFWNALNARSGENWPIFSAKPLKQGSYKFPESPAGAMSYMVRKWCEPLENKPFIKFFGLDDTEDLPCFVTFIWGDDGKLKTIITPIRGRTSDDVYNILQDIIDIITKAESRILDEYKQTENVFREVKQDLEAKELRTQMGKSFSMLSKVRLFLGLFR